MTDTRGTFRLKNVRQDILNNEYVPIPSVWLPAPPLNPDTADTAYWGAFGGGGDSLYKIPVPSDTWSLLPANLGAVNAGDATGSQTAGFISGGYSYSWYKKLTYSSDTTSTAHPGGGNAYRNYDNTAITDGDNGYWLGGERVPGGAALSSSEKLTYASSTVSAGPNLPETRAGFIGSTGSTTTGYMCGGATPGRRSNMFKLVYSSSTMSTVPGAEYPAPIGSGDQSGNGVTDTHGYFVGGHQPSGAMSVNCKLTYSNETFAREPGGNLPRSSYYLSTTGNREKGYWGGGETIGSPNPVKNSDVFKLTYSNSTFANVPSSIQFNPNSWGEKARGWGPRKGGVPAVGSVQRWFDSATETGNKMYCMGGTGGGEDHDSFDMTTETTTNLGSIFDELEKGCSAQNTTHSYIHAGGGKQTKVRKITWSTDTGTTLPGTTSRPAENKSGTGNETKGYFTQGSSSPGPCYSGSDRVTYASDTIERVPGADMVGGRPGKFGAQATGNQETGYFMGGGGEWPGFPNYSDTNKLTYATDTNANCPAQMPTGMSMYAGSSASSSTAAYASNYRNPSFHSKVFKLVFATDTVDTVGNTTVQRNGPAMGGNSTTMYMGGGSNFPNGDRSDFDKLVYATDTISNLSNSNLQSARYYITGSGQRGERIPFAEPPTATPTSSTTLTGPQGIKAEGYLIQGIQGATTSPSGRSDVYRLNYNTDTWDSSVFANSTLTRKRAGAASNTTAAYVGGGGLGAADGNPTGGDMDKLTYATSTMSRIPGSDAGNIPGRSTDATAAGNQTQGYWTFGTGNQSKCDKLVYSTETAAALPNLPWNAKNTVAVSMQTAGYYGSGDGFDDENTSFTRITFSNDTYATYSGWFYTPGGFAARYRCGSSSSTKAYIVGGQNAPRCMDVTPWATNSTSNSPTTFLQSPGFYKAPGQGSNEAGYFTGGGNVGNNGTNTEKITYSTDTTAMVPSAKFPTSEPYGVNSYSTGGPNMNGLGTNVPNVI